MSTTLFALLLLLLAGCGGADGVPEPGGSAAGGDAVDPSDELFRVDRVVEVDITLAPADWEILRHQPAEVGAPKANCADPSAPDPYSYFPAEITVDGETVSNVAVRKKGGFGSLSTSRPGLRVDAHEYVESQRIFGLKHLTLNNNVQDPTLISQCLGYGLFRAAGLPASRCGFAHVTVNGEDLGVYSNVETIKPQFLRRHFDDDSGNLYESGGEFVPGAVGGFQPKTHPKDPDCSDLDPVVEALAAPDAELAARLGAVVDLDEFMRFWAMEVITDHWDGYTNNRNNYFFYHDPTSDKLHFIPWGIDALFTGRERTTRPDSVFACGSVAWHLYDVAETRATYLATLRDLLATVWDQTALLDEIGNMQALLEPIVDPTGEGGFAGRLDDVRTFVSNRAGVLLAELDAGDPVWPYPAGEKSCRISLGTLTASFDTTWGTLGQFGVGSGAMEGTVAGVALDSSTVYASAGLDEESKPALQIISPVPDGRYAVVFVLVDDPANITPGTRPVDLVNVAAFMVFYDPATETASGGGLLLPGTFTLTSAGTVSGSPFVGSITGEVIEL